jgi:hypothetical protein
VSREARDERFPNCWRMMLQSVLWLAKLIVCQEIRPLNQCGSMAVHTGLSVIRSLTPHLFEARAALGVIIVSRFNTEVHDTFRTTIAPKDLDEALQFLWEAKTMNVPNIREFLESKQIYFKDDKRRTLRPVHDRYPHIPSLPRPITKMGTKCF